MEPSTASVLIRVDAAFFYKLKPSPSLWINHSALSCFYVVEGALQRKEVVVKRDGVLGDNNEVVSNFFLNRNIHNHIRIPSIGDAMSKWVVSDGTKYYAYPGKDGDDWAESLEPIEVDGLDLPTLMLLIEDSFDVGGKMALERVA